MARRVEDSPAGERGVLSGLLPGRPAILARAPGRLDVMGGIADYSGATVLELPLAYSVRVAAQETDDGQLSVHSGGPAAPRLADTTVSVPARVLDAGAAARAPERLRGALDEANALWAAYLLGPLAILYAHELIGPVHGLRLSVWSDVPAGAGVSSSAALEVAALRALQGLYGIVIDALRLAELAQQAEHRVALAPCGIMDQVTAVMGRKDHLLRLRCQPADVQGHVRLPDGVRVYGIDSGVAHRVAGAQYGRVRVAAFMGRAIIAAQGAGDPPGGYLCNLAPQSYAARYEAELPETISGAAFRERYGETGDAATSVEPDALYTVRACTAHPVYEQANVEAFLSALDSYTAHPDNSYLVDAGAAMYRSHDSYGQRCGLGTPETDRIVDLVREAGPRAGLFGAKITGGGAGGTVAVLADGDAARDAVEAVAAAYARESGNRGRVIAGSADGALGSTPRRVLVDERGDIHDR